MAPMMGYNEAPLRQICRRFGSGLAVTEMIKPEKLLRGDKETLEDLTCDPALERPLGAQVAVREAGPLVEASLQLAARGFEFIDLNVGCPLKKECNRGWGASLLREPERLGRLVEATVSALDVPVTVKLRAGYELGELLAPEAARVVVEAGASMVCVHGRTKMGWYKEPNCLDAIARVREAVAGRVPVVGNGDVTSLEDALRMFHHTGCDAVMIGRGAMGNPWLFERIHAYLTRGEILAEPGFSQVRELYFEHLRAMQELIGTRRGFVQVRRYAFHYFGRLGLPREWRPRVATARDSSELTEVIDAFGQTLAA
jgi:tRNA-dihydrouridine synthase B